MYFLKIYWKTQHLVLYGVNRTNNLGIKLLQFKGSFIQTFKNALNRQFNLQETTPMQIHCIVNSSNT